MYLEFGIYNFFLKKKEKEKKLNKIGKTTFLFRDNWLILIGFSLMAYNVRF